MDCRIRLSDFPERFAASGPLDVCEKTLEFISNNQSERLTRNELLRSNDGLGKSSARFRKYRVSGFGFLARRSHWRRLGTCSGVCGGIITP